MDKLKYIKLENEDGSYSSSIPLAVDSDHVDINGMTLTNAMAEKASSSIVSDLLTEVNTQSARIDSLARLDDGSTTGDAELIDGRTDDSGVIYTNIGSNIRNIASNLTEINGKNYLIPGLYGWNFTSSSEPPTVDNVYKGYGHASIELHKGDMIKLKANNVKFKYIRKTSENTYVVNNTFKTADFLIQDDGLYYLTYSFTPEHTNVTSELNRLGSFFEIVLNSNSLVGEVKSQKNKIANSLTGLDETGRTMLLNIFDKIVFTEDMSASIQEFLKYIAGKTDLIIDLENKRIANGQGSIWGKEGFCVTKKYMWKEPCHSVTLYFECDETSLSSVHVMQFLDNSGSQVEYMALNQSARTNKEFTWTKDNENWYGIRATLITALRDNDYIYKTDTGEIIFAGKNSKYANMSNIYEKGI